MNSRSVSQKAAKSKQVLQAFAGLIVLASICYLIGIAIHSQLNKERTTSQETNKTGKDENSPSQFDPASTTILPGITTPPSASIIPPSPTTWPNGSTIMPGTVTPPGATITSPNTTTWPGSTIMPGTVNPPGAAITPPETTTWPNGSTVMPGTTTNTYGGYTNPPATTTWPYGSTPGGYATPPSTTTNP